MRANDFSGPQPARDADVRKKHRTLCVPAGGGEIRAEPQAMGLIAHTCVEATVRYAAKLGYEVTVVKDATASYSDEYVHAALELNIPNYASALVTTDEIVRVIYSRAVEVAAGS